MRKNRKRNAVLPEAAREAGGSGFLFGFACLSPEEAMDVAEQNNRLVLCRYLQGGSERYMAVQLPTGNPDNEFLDEFVPLRDARESVTATLKAVDGAELKEFDYSDLVSRTFTGADEAGGAYSLTITSADSYQVRGTLTYTGAGGETHSAAVLVLLLQTGKLAYEDETGAQGYGELSLEGSVCSLTLKGEEGSWLSTEALILRK